MADPCKSGDLENPKKRKKDSATDTNDLTTTPMCRELRGVVRSVEVKAVALSGVDSVSQDSVKHRTGKAC
ncbi:hypothetical protein AOLI_G00173790 [Acnodon oligacanthus]